MTDPPPQLRPIRLQGKPYYAELKRILRTEGADILGTLARWRQGGATLTPALIGALAITHTLNFKAMCEFLEDSSIIPCGTYDRITEQHRPTAVLRAGQEWLSQQDGPSAIQVAFEQARK